MAFLSPRCSKPHIPFLIRCKYTPYFVIELLRRADRAGGIKSTSVSRMCATHATAKQKQEQLYWNQYLPNSHIDKYPSRYAMANNGGL